MTKGMLAAICVITVLNCALFLVSCGKTQRPENGQNSGTGTQNGTDTQSGSDGTGNAAGTATSGEKGTTPVGTWYEQAEYADRLEITEKKISYFSGNSSYTSEMAYTLKKENSMLRLETEDFFVYEDMYYDKKEDMLICYTMSHTDGDGGHHRVEFRRYEYVAPPAPTYDPPVDLSDPDAKKEFEDLTFRSMEVSFYDEGEPYDVNSSMAMQPPFADEYSYSLKVLEDGSGLVSSSYCQEIELPKETVDALQELVRETDLGQINGIDIHTKGLPYGSPDYAAEIELASGDIIRSSANGSDVPENWAAFQYSMHRLLFDAFVDAGYKYGSGEFHSTKAMKRIGAENVLRGSESGFSFDYKYIIPDYKKAYDYSLDGKYFTFTGDSGKYPALVKTLNALCVQYREKVEKDLEVDYRAMQAVPKSVWKKAQRRYCYSNYAVDHWGLSGNIFSFMVSEGHANSLGAGERGYGKYRYIRYNIDADTGKILCVNDLFENADGIYNALMEIFSNYGTHNDSGKFVHSDAFPAFLKKALENPEPEGIGFNIAYDYLELWMPLGMYEGNDSQLREILYYDEIQDILADQYTEIW